MPARQFYDAIASARTGADLDELSRRLWRTHAEGRLADSAAEDVSEAIAARRAALSGKAAGKAGPAPKAACEAPRGHKRGPGPRREKLFGAGRPRALDRNAKARILHRARCLSRRTQKGRAYGQITAKALAVLEALLWGFHNAKNGLCFPSYEKIAEAAGCARSTVASSIKALEDAGILTWIQRIKRVREQCSDLLGANGWRWRVMRTSNAYNFRDPGAPDHSKSEKPTGTPNQEFSSSMGVAVTTPRPTLTAAILPIAALAYKP